MKTPTERGPIGAWAYTARREAGVSVDEVADRLRERGVQVSPATLRGIESGSKKPGRALLGALSELYGQHPPRVSGADSDLSSLVEAANRQATANEKVAELLEGILGALTSMGPPPEPDLTPQEREEYEALMRSVEARRRTTPLPQHDLRTPLE